MLAVLSGMACKGGREPRCLCLLSVFKGCSHCRREATEALPAVVAGGLAGGEELRCLCLLSVLKGCSHRRSGAAEAMPAVVAGWFDGLQEEKS